MVNRPDLMLITSTGLVGGNISAVLRDNGRSVIQTYYPSVDKPQGMPVDITQRASINELFAKAKPGVVILSAALTNVEFCQENRETAWNINVTGPRNVAEACKEHGAKMVFFSSDYVFDGQNGPYSENDATHPISVYGETKLAAESLIRKTLDNFLIIRTTIVYGYEELGKNFCYRLINTIKSGQNIRVPVDQIGSPTYARNLAEVVVDLIKNNKSGLYNVVGGEQVDRYEFAKRVCAVFGLDKKLIIPVTTAELEQKAPRPLKAGLKVDKVRKDSGVKIMGIDESLRAFKKELYG